MDKTNWDFKPKPVNTGTMRDGKLDEKLHIFRTDPVSEVEGIVAFQFETGGFTIAFKRGMSMTEVADKLEGTARRVRQYQERGWPDAKAYRIDGAH